MQTEVSNGILAALAGLPQAFIYGFAGISAIFLGFIAVKVYWRLRGNSAHNSYQQGVVAPVQYGDRGAPPPTPEEVFARRLDALAEAEETYDLEKLKPKARQLGAIAKTTFQTAPVLDSASLTVLALIEEVLQEVDAGFRLLMHTGLDSLVDLAGSGADSVTTKLSMAGIELKFAVVDRYGRLAMAVDYQGGQARSKQDYINRSITIEILRKAGVWYLEIPQKYSEQDARTQLFAVLCGKADSARGRLSDSDEDVA